MSPSTSTIYWVETKLSHSEVRELLSRLDVAEETSRGDVLDTGLGLICRIEIKKGASILSKAFSLAWRAPCRYLLYAQY
jgi:hypothetical protein